jgi:ketosteroid isomerase-like protein
VAAGDAEIVREPYDLFNRGEYEASTAALHEDVVLHQWDEIPDTDTYVGRHGFARAIGRWASGFEPGFQFAIEEIAEEGGRVWVRVRLSGRGRGSGIDLDQVVFHVWTVRDGQPAECWVFSDLDESLRAARGEA